MKKLDLRALELAGMILCAIVDLAIIAAAVFLYVYTGHAGWMALLLIVVWSFGLFMPFDYHKTLNKLDEYKEKEKEVVRERKGYNKISIPMTLICDKDEVLRAFFESQENKKKEEVNPFFVPVDNGGATPI